MCLAHSLLVSCDFVYTRAKLCRIFRLFCEFRKAAEKFFYSFHFKGGAKIYRVELPTFDGISYRICRHMPLRKIFLHELVRAHRKLLADFFEIKARFGCLRSFRNRPGCQNRLHVRKSVAKICRKLRKYPTAARSCSIHLIYKYKDRHAIRPEKRPDCKRMRLHTLRAAHHQNRIIKHRKRALRLHAEIHMTRGVQKRKLRIARAKSRFL